VITHIDPPEAWGVRGVDGPIRATVDVTVAPLNDGQRSRVTIELDLTGHGIGKVLVPLMVRRSAQKEMPANLDRLKQRVNGFLARHEPPRFMPQPMRDPPRPPACDLSPGGEDSDLGDLDRGRGLDVSRSSEGWVPVVRQSRRGEESLDLVGAEAEPKVGLFDADPFVGVLAGVGDRDPSVGPDGAGHLGEHASQILRVVKDHVRDRGIDGVVVDGESGEVGLADLDVERALIIVLLGLLADRKQTRGRTERPSPRRRGS
jgi:hypothetical protein